MHDEQITDNEAGKMELLNVKVRGSFAVSRRKMVTALETIQRKTMINYINTMAQPLRQYRLCPVGSGSNRTVVVGSRTIESRRLITFCVKV